MSSTQELDSPALSGPSITRDESSLFEVSRSPYAIREVPVVLLGTAGLPTSLQVTLHYPRLYVEGLQDLIPDQLELDISSLVDGGAIRIDQLQLPPCCEVIGVWFTNPVVTVAAAE
jgi:hypothetical protein